MRCGLRSPDAPATHAWVWEGGVHWAIIESDNRNLQRKVLLRNTCNMLYFSIQD